MTTDREKLPAMTDNVKGEFRRSELTVAGKIVADRLIAHLAERGMVVPGPDGEPQVLTPLLRALGDEAWPFKWTTINGRFHSENRPGALRRLAEQGITGPLAAACLAAAEVEGP